MPLNFKNKVLLEQIRQLEESSVLPDPVATLPNDVAGWPANLSFEERLLKRANSLNRQHQLQASLDKPARIHRYVMIAAYIVVACLGVFAVANALSVNATAQHSINIYWLLLVLLGFNVLSMSLWIVGNLSNISGLVSGAISRLPLSALQALPANRSPAASAWFTSHYTGNVGLWRISATSHLLWLVYLVAGLATLLLFLAAQQYDFYWGSTLLSVERFADLTEMLSRPLAALGFAVPSTELLDISRAGINVTSPESRQQWAFFLIAALIIYGIVPRFICWLISRLLLQHNEKKFSPDFYLPYYIHLRQALMPTTTVSTIVDDNVSTPKHITLNSEEFATYTQQDSILENVSWPANSIIIGIELLPPTDQFVAVNILKKADYTQAVNVLQRDKNCPVAVLADMHNLPDRGVQRQINTLLAERKTNERWLLILGKPATDKAQDSVNIKQRLTDWYHSAQQAGVPAAQVQWVNARQFTTSTADSDKVNNDH